MEDLGIEAKEAAVREVAKLLPLPELLSSIASIKSDYLARQQTNDAQLSTMVAEQVFLDIYYELPNLLVLMLLLMLCSSYGFCYYHLHSPLNVCLLDYSFSVCAYFITYRLSKPMLASMLLHYLRKQ
ncbi:Os02g0749500 [Oryza sativa Japonica Group]|uniref:Os02g0749500 protein n=2 Tax=Oryza sativa subsp. japonica TaxID=39947 RepID=A0A0P0VQ25_ORYSJ|nr:hypothetical protein EE612_013705 [Oryza sativa]BAS80934.1 Os02g0749500 [Oryza sativa Japonica Group]